MGGPGVMSIMIGWNGGSPRGEIEGSGMCGRIVHGQPFGHDGGVEILVGGYQGDVDWPGHQVDAIDLDRCGELHGVVGA